MVEAYEGEEDSADESEATQNPFILHPAKQYQVLLPSAKSQVPRVPLKQAKPYLRHTTWLRRQ